MLALEAIHKKAYGQPGRHRAARDFILFTQAVESAQKIGGLIIKIWNSRG